MLEKLEEIRQKDAIDTGVEGLQNSGRTSNAIMGQTRWLQRNANKTN